MINHFFTAICDIGSAAFNYDMRRLNEILDVPKAWYKRSLMQRLFLGKEGAYATQTSMSQPNKTPSESTNTLSTETSNTAASTSSNKGKPTVEPIPTGTPETPRSTRISRQQSTERRTPGKVYYDFSNREELFNSALFIQQYMSRSYA